MNIKNNGQLKLLSDANIPKAQICVWELYPMELVETRRRFGAEIVFYEKGSTIPNYHDKRNMSIVRKKLADALDVAKKWKEKFKDIDETGVYIIA